MSSFPSGPFCLVSRSISASDSKEEKDTQRTFENPNGRVIDLILPVLVLIVCCVLGMLYSGGFFSGVDFVSAFAGSDASVGLALGSIFALLLTILYYCLRRIMSFRECCDCLPYGFIGLQQIVKK